MSVEEDTKMLKRMTTEFTAAVRVIVAENVNVLQCFVRDIGSLLARLGLPQRNARLREDKKLI